MNISALGFCGLNCEECPVFIATARNDDALRQKTAREWSRLYTRYLKRNLRTEEMNCGGCRSERGLFTCSRDCPIRMCCQERELATCADCDEYTKCDILNGFFTFHHQNAKDNLERIRTGR